MGFVFGLMFGVLFFMNGVETSQDKYLLGVLSLLSPVAGGLTTILVLNLLKKTNFVLSEKQTSWVHRSSVFFLLPAAFMPWMQSVYGLLILAVLCSFVAGFTSVVLSSKKEEVPLLAGNRNFVSILFFFSGFAALIYQVSWQRILFQTFGVNSESVTAIVSVFMFGLGMGALLGGKLQKAFPKHLILLFAIIELVIGCFGFISPELIRVVGGSLANLSLWEMTAVVYGLLLVPTLMMGATLPVLVSFMRNKSSLSSSIGELYAFNTLGSAVAALLTVLSFFPVFGLSTSIYVAALFNLSVAGAIAYIYGSDKGTPPQPIQPQEYEKGEISFAFASLMMFLIGFISLGQEMIWYRLAGFMTGSNPKVFGVLLFAFLLGIAISSLKSISALNKKHEIMSGMSKATFVFAISFPLVSLVSSFIPAGISVLLVYVAIALTSFYSGKIFPLLISAAQDETGERVFILYFMNIVGASIGPLVVGFILFDHLSLIQNVIVMGVLSVVFWVAISLHQRITFVGTAWIFSSVFIFCAYPFITEDFLSNVHFTKLPGKLQDVVENKSGILTVAKNEEGTDIIYGNGVYDGAFNADPVSNQNMIDRIYSAFAFHEKPTKVLEIGLSSGSWAKAIARHKDIKQITVIELNEGYEKLIRENDATKSIYGNDKFLFVYDDGRRWLKNNRDQKFDVIVMNATFHWRSNASSLLSKDFISATKSSLNKGGFVFYNSTLSEDVFKTAAEVFPYVTRVANFVLASNDPFVVDKEVLKSRLLNFVDENGEVLFEKNEMYQNKRDEMVKSLKGNLKAYYDTSKYSVITDDNMLSEFRPTPIYEPHP